MVDPLSLVLAVENSTTQLNVDIVNYLLLHSEKFDAVKCEENIFFIRMKSGVNCPNKKKDNGAKLRHANSQMIEFCLCLCLQQMVQRHACKLETESE